MLGLNPMELLIIGVVAVLLFGNKLPGYAKSLGAAIPSFRKGLTGIEEN